MCSVAEEKDLKYFMKALSKSTSQDVYIDESSLQGIRERASKIKKRRKMMYVASAVISATIIAITGLNIYHSYSQGRKNLSKVSTERHSSMY